MTSEQQTSASAPQPGLVCVTHIHKQAASIFGGDAVCWDCLQERREVRARAISESANRPRFSLGD